MNVIVLDTETSGLPVTKGFGIYFDPSNSKYYDKSRLIELGYIVYNNNDIQLFERNYLVKPNNFVVTNTNIHNITNEELKTKGLPIIDVLEILESDLDNVGTMVCHNVKFDLHILLSECYRFNKFTLIEKLSKLKLICTMEMGKKALNQAKYPKLDFLHSTLIGPSELSSHRALNDAKMCANCYQAIKKLT